MEFIFLASTCKQKELYKMYEITKTYVVFTNTTGLWWLKFLKSGFRHCYLLFSMQNGRKWLEINPYSNQVVISLHRFSKAQSIEDILRIRGDNLSCAVQIKNAPQKCAPLGFFTCVELVKRVLGIHSARIITPYQLYKKLKVVGKNS